MSISENTDKPKVSVIIPVYNVKQYLKEALDSVIHQTYKNIEIIIVDDGSNDGSEKICDEYAGNDSRIRVIHEENGGLSVARNTGLDNMSGEYVAFLDSDDIYYPDMIQKMLESLLSHKTDCAVCRYTVFNTKQKINLNSKKKTNEKIYTRAEALKAIINGEIHAFAWNKLYKKNLFDSVRYPAGQNYEDISVVFKIFDKTNKVSVLDEKLVYYRKHRQSITSTYTLKNFQDLHTAQNIFISFVKEHIPEIYTEKELKKIYHNWMKMFIYKYAKTLHKNIPEKKDIESFLKNIIQEYNLNNEIKNLGIETRICYNLLFNAPAIFSLFALFYPAIRKFIFRCFAK